MEGWEKRSFRFFSVESGSCKVILGTQAVWYCKSLGCPPPRSQNQPRYGPGALTPAEVKLKLNNSLRLDEKLASLHQSLEMKNPNFIEVARACHIPKGITQEEEEASHFVHPASHCVAAGREPTCYTWRHGTPVISPAVRLLHGGKLQYSAGIVVFKSSKVMLSVQPRRRQLIQEHGHNSAR